MIGGCLRAAQLETTAPAVSARTSDETLPNGKAENHSSGVRWMVG